MAGPDNVLRDFQRASSGRFCTCPQGFETYRRKVSKGAGPEKLKGIEGVADIISQVKVTNALLTEIKDKIVEHFQPVQIILFGSYAYGDPDRDSDIDLLVVMESDLRPAARSAAVIRVCRPRYVSMDVVVRTPEEIEKQLECFDPFLEEILERGRVLYRSIR